MALLCTGFWDRWWAQGLLLPWLEGFPNASLGFWSLKIQQHKQQLSQASSSAALPWFLSSEHQRIANYLLLQSPHSCEQGSLPSTSPLLPTGCSVSMCCLQPLHLWDCWHRDILVSLQAHLMCSFFNKPSSEKLHCADSLYFTDFSSISLSSSIFKNVSNCYCTGIDG